MKLKPLALAALIAIPTAVAAWIGASYISAGQVERALQATRAASSTSSALRVVDLQHERGLLKSGGTLNLRVDDSCGAPTGAEAVTVQLRYHVDHFPTHQGPVRFSWTLEPTGDMQAALRRVIPAGLSLQGAGHRAYGGAINSSLALGEVVARQGRSSVQVSASTGQLTLDGKALVFDWTTPRIVIRGEGEAAELTEATVRARLVDAARGTGTIEFGFGKFSAPFGSAEGFSLATSALEEGDRLNASITPRLRRVSTPAMTLEDLSLELGVKGLDTASVFKLIELAQASCGLQALTPEEQATGRKAARTLLTRGFSAGITKIGGKTPDGAVDGQWMFELAAAPDGNLRLEQQLQSKGHLSIGGKTLTPQQLSMAVDSGLAVPHEGGLRAAYEWRAGALKVNDQPVDSTPIRQALELIGLALAGTGGL